MALRKAQIFAGMLLLVFGACRQAPPPDFPVWFQSPEPAPVADGDPFGMYVIAANRALADDPLGIARVSFTKGQKEESLKRLAPALRTLSLATGVEAKFTFQPKPPFVPNPQRPGWRLLGRALVWQCEFALESGDGSALVTATRRLYRFSAMLRTGGALDADIGWTLLDEHRALVAPRLPDLDSQTLFEIASITDGVRQNNDEWNAVISNEKDQMLAAVQYLQDAYQKSDFKDARTRLGTEAREGIDFLERMRGSDGPSRAEYFKNFAAEIDEEIQTVRSALETPAALRESLPVPEGQRPWRRFAKQFFRTLRPLLDRSAKTITRTKLLGLEARIWSQLKTTGKAPANLQEISPQAAFDPYTGREFGYAATGKVFRLYSVGQDGVDNGGKTDEVFESPDFTLER